MVRHPDHDGWNRGQNSRICRKAAEIKFCQGTVWHHGFAEERGGDVHFVYVLDVKLGGGSFCVAGGGARESGHHPPPLVSRSTVRKYRYVTPFWPRFITELEVSDIDHWLVC